MVDSDLAGDSRDRKFNTGLVRRVEGKESV